MEIDIVGSWNSPLSWTRPRLSPDPIPGNGGGGHLSAPISEPGCGWGGGIAPCTPSKAQSQETATPSPQAGDPAPLLLCVHLLCPLGHAPLHTDHTWMCAHPFPQSTSSPLLLCAVTCKCACTYMWSLDACVLTLCMPNPPKSQDTRIPGASCTISHHRLPEPPQGTSMSLHLHDQGTPDGQHPHQGTFRLAFSDGGLTTSRDGCQDCQPREDRDMALSQRSGAWHTGRVGNSWP